METMNGKKYLITTDGWFYGPDGGQYRGVYGTVNIVEDSILGIKTNARSSNWFARVGDDDVFVVIAGCQIHYAVKCDSVNSEKVTDFGHDKGKTYEYQLPPQYLILK